MTDESIIIYIINSILQYILAVSVPAVDVPVMMQKTALPKSMFLVNL